MFRLDRRQSWKRHPAIARRVRLAFDCLEDRRTPAAIASDFAFAGDFLADHGPATSTVAAVAPTATVRSQATGGDGPIEFLHPFCLISVGTADDSSASDDNNGLPPLMPELSPAAPRSAPRSETPSAPPSIGSRVELDAPPIFTPREETSAVQDSEPAPKAPTLSLDDADEFAIVGPREESLYA